MPLISVRDLVITAPGRHTYLPLLDHVNIDIPEHQTTGLTGPSGGGKTLLAKFLTGLTPQNLEITNGPLRFRGKTVHYGELAKFRGNTLFYTPQNPAAALNPVRKIKYQMAEGLTPCPSLEKMAEILEELNISSPTRVLNSYSFQLSGGECQRALLAMALLRKPQLLVLDEPTASLDPEAGESLLRLLDRLQASHSFAVLLISHDSSVMEQICSNHYCMNKGKLSKR